MDAAAMGRGRQAGGEHGHDETKDEDHDCAEAGDASAQKTSPLAVHSSRYSGSRLGGHRPTNVVCP